MTNYFSSNFKLGVLGGGQLGKMLLTATQQLDIYTSVLESNKNAPCATLANEFVIGDWKNYDDVYHFGKTVDVLTIEIEHVNVKALYQLQKEGTKVYPQPEILEIIQNKGLQKDFYRDNNIPTSPYKRFTTKEELAKANLTFPCIWKSEKDGYDGTGVKKLENKNDIESLPETNCLVEDLVAIKKELAVIVARNTNGEIKVFPTVEMEFNAKVNQVEYVICPANISKKIDKKAKEVAIQISNAFKHVGLLAVELFLDNNNDLIVNEIAPRPHNSGHFSIDASFTNQFKQHVRAILNLPLGNTKSKLPAVMVNLVGEPNEVGNVVYENIEQCLAKKGVNIHLYGKKETKPFRKMGHVTIVNKKASKAKKIAKEVKELLKVKAE